MTLWKNFTVKEMRCRCGCNQINMDDHFMEKLEALRVRCEFAFPVTSGYRCGRHPEELKKAQPGAHGHGRAADIQVSGALYFKIMDLAPEYGMTGIGSKQHGPHDQRMIHLDDMPDAPHRPRPTGWTYP